jgi:putative transposase
LRTRQIDRGSDCNVFEEDRLIGRRFEVRSILASAVGVARRPRVYIPGAAVHVIQRGNNRGPIFSDDQDYLTFLEFLKTSAAKRDTSVHGFNLMKNHYHLLVTPGHKTALARTVKHFGQCYVQYYNRKYGRTGTLWDGRYRDPIVAEERYFFTCLRYIERNPVKAGMVNSPEEYRWSSYRFHAYGQPSAWLVPHPLYLALGKTPKERQAAYRALSKLLPDADLGSDPQGAGDPQDEGSEVIPAPVSVLIGV